jgi:hypothetical protein
MVSASNITHTNILYTYTCMSNIAQTPAIDVFRCIMLHYFGFLTRNVIGVRCVFSGCGWLLFRQDLEFAIQLETYVCLP